MAVTGPEVFAAVPAAQLPDDATLLDVREADEWTAGHAPHASHLPMSELVARLAEVPTAANPLYVICRSGSRSARVVAFLGAQGISAANVDGGMQAWIAAGRPVVSDRGTTGEIV